jgi:Carboxypeptidase regulatory-like domain/TonB dependent receptor
MPRRVAAFFGGSAWVLLAAASALAQGRNAPALVTRQASVGSGAIAGVVRDGEGQAVPGVSILALGAAPLPALARTDTSGRFELTLPAGEYILRATRDGYVSTYREPVRIQSSTTLERNITLVRQGAAHPVVMLAGAVIPAGQDDPHTPAVILDPLLSDHPHDEAAWRLRHLPPTALRDIAGTDAAEARVASQFRPHLSVIDWVMGESTRAATSFFTNTNFTGQINFLTSGSLGANGALVPAAVLPRGIAYAAISAPVGSSGDWTVRAAMTPGNTSSWVLLGQYEAHADQAHAFKVRLSYSSQLSANGDPTALAAVNDQARSAGGFSVRDRWHVKPALELDYGVRLDRYDYVQGADSFSPSLGARLALLPRTHLIAQASQRSIAPGADEFLPPPSAGPWLPPERTFAPLLASVPFRAERVRDYEVGLEQELGGSALAPVVGVRRLRQSSSHQIATLFGLDTESDVGHYYVADPGQVDLDVWVFRASGRMFAHVRGSVEYAIGGADWRASRDAGPIGVAVPSIVRASGERMSDLTTLVEAASPDGSTRLSLSYRANCAFSRSATAAAEPALAGRFAFELHQALPVRPTPTSRLELMLSVRNLFRDLAEMASMYDELLTVAPPLRIMGGVQVKF